MLLRILGWVISMGLIGVLQAQNSFFQLESPAFQNQGRIPKQFSCQGENTSPPLIWKGAPEDTKSYALIMIDYDARKTKGHPLVHWVAYDIDASLNQLEIDTKNIKVGLNSYGNKGYVGMCPPAGPEHHYYFKFYALDISHLEIQKFPTIAKLTEAMQQHIIAEANMVASYQRS
jgi:Raf kinase inhibitor-like YbhB/YbcL family protein